jgi:glycine/D-amino acid oxidase-like deaminating enzyme
MGRRTLVQGSAILGGLGLAGCARLRPGTGAIAAYDPVPALAPIRAHRDRVFDITVCLRPFRAAGPRLDTEQVGDTLVVHNYGHGGSGWSLSWGSSTLAVQKAMAGSPRDVAVIGCGALGLTSAILAQRAGARVTIYAREMLPQTRSARATGSWTPDSRIALVGAAGPGFAAVWEEMARISFKMYRTYLGLPGEPVEWIDYYTLSDTDLDDPNAGQSPPERLDFARYRPRIRDLTPAPQTLPAGATPFDSPHQYRSETMMFNISGYGHTLMSDFLLAGGQMRRMEFFAPSELTRLKEKVVINCPGYGARALWNDPSVVPVRGQIAWLIPQPELRYGVFYKDVNVLSRRDGIVVQAIEGGDMKGYGIDQEIPDRGEADRAVDTIASLFSRFRA